MYLKNVISRCSGLWRMSAVRQAAILTLLFLALLILAGFSTIALLYQEIERSINQELLSRHQVISQQLNNSNTEQLSLPGSYLAFASLRRSTGEILGPNHPKLFNIKGYADIELDIASDSDDWKVLSAAHPQGQLVVGVNTEKRYKPLKILGELFITLGLLTILLTLCSGLLIGLSNQRRFNQINATLEQVAKGNFEARVDIKSKNDDLDRLGQRIDSTTEHLAQLVQQSRDLSANIAHDLKTPLARLRANLERSLEQPVPDHGVIEIALQQTDQMILTFEAILRIAHLSSGQYRSRFTQLSLKSLIQEIAEIYQAVIEDSNHFFELQLAQCSDIVGDRELIIQMVANLLENALRHTAAGTTITLSCEGTRITVSDNGPGIESQYRKKVLQPMYRLEKSRHSAGNGLGLSMVSTIAQLHHATLLLDAVDTTVAAPGLKVVINLPVAQSEREKKR